MQNIFVNTFDPLHRGIKNTIYFVKLVVNYGPYIPQINMNSYQPLSELVNRSSETHHENNTFSKIAKPNFCQHNVTLTSWKKLSGIFVLILERYIHKYVTINFSQHLQFLEEFSDQGESLFWNSLWKHKFYPKYPNRIFVNRIWLHTPRKKYVSYLCRYIDSISLSTF